MVHLSDDAILGYLKGKCPIFWTLQKSIVDLFYSQNLVKGLQKCEEMAGCLFKHAEFVKNIQSEMQTSKTFAV